MNFAVLQFPGSNCDQDCVHVFRNVLGHSASLLWHKEKSVGDADAVLVPGGFSYGDYLRTGSIARFSPVMSAVKEFADQGGYVLGICNGFQILCETGLLPGALIRNRSLQFRCEHVYLKVANHDSPFTNQIPEDRVLRIPIAHGEGRFVPENEEILRELEESGRIACRYGATDNPNGSVGDVMGICDASGLVLGLMPHPERYLRWTQHPTWTRLSSDSMASETVGLQMFRNAVSYVQKKRTTEQVEPVVLTDAH